MLVYFICVNLAFAVDLLTGAQEAWKSLSSAVSKYSKYLFMITAGFSEMYAY